MRNFSLDRVTFGAALALISGWAACTPPADKPAAAPPQATAEYQPNFKYHSGDSGQRLDMTVGIVNPVFANESTRSAYLGDPVVKNMLRALGANFNDVLIAKGFKTIGPFTTVEDMSFPDKKSSDLLLYAQFDYDVLVKPKAKEAAAPPPPEEKSGMLGGMLKLNDANAKAAPPPPPVKRCDISVGVNGNVQFLAIEPLSKEKFFNKTLELTGPSENVPDQAGDSCNGGAPSDSASQELKNAWAKAHETVFQMSMKALDTYINGQEFVALKKQSQEVRDKKSY
jgi:hypothetical protein